MIFFNGALSGTVQVLWNIDHLLEWWKAEEAAMAKAASELVSDEDPLGFSLVVVEQLPSLDLLNLKKECNISILSHLLSH